MKKDSIWLGILLGIVLFIMAYIINLISTLTANYIGKIGEILGTILTLLSPLVLGYMYSYYYKEDMHIKIRDKVSVVCGMLILLVALLSLYIRPKSAKLDVGSIFEISAYILISTLVGAAINFWLMGLGSKLYFIKKNTK